MSEIIIEYNENDFMVIKDKDKTVLYNNNPNKHLSEITNCKCVVLPTIEGQEIPRK